MTESNYEFGTSILTSKTPLQAAAILPHTLNTSQSLVQTKLIGWFQQYSAELQRHNYELGKLLSEGAGILGYGPPPSSPTAKSKSSKPDATGTASEAPRTNPDDLGSFNKVWNTFLRSIELEVHSNEQYFKNIKLETLGPLKEFITNDVRYSELVLNSSELQDIARDLTAGGNNNAEYQWNVKAPQIFDNLENFEKIKSQLLFDIILNYFNSSNTKFAKLTSNSENSVNYLLGTYKLDDEMKIYLQYLLKSDFTSELSTPPPPPPSQKQQEKRLSSFGHKSSNHAAHGNHDLASTHSSASGTSTKKPSKLKSKVGSIFGRRNKRKSTNKLGNSETIPETESITSSVAAPDLSRRASRGGSRSVLNRSTDSLGNALGGGRRDSDLYHTKNEQPVSTPPAVTNNVAPVTKTTETSSASAAGPFSANAGGFGPAPTTAATSSASGAPPVFSTSAAPLTPKQKQPPVPDPIVSDSPNVVKYSSSDDEADTSATNNGVSLLQKHNLHNIDDRNVVPPTNTVQPLHNEHFSQSSTAGSAGKFSFEAGDDERPISATPKEQQRNVFDDAYDESASSTNGATHGLPTAAVGAAAGAVAGAAVGAASGAFSNGDASHAPAASISSGSAAAPPPPPPSRKAHGTNIARDDQSILSEGSNVPSASNSKRSNIKSQYFHNLPNARDSIISTPRALTSQDTGNSILKHLNNSSGDIFKHAEEQYQTGLNASIAEVINARFKDDKIIRQQLIGEVAFNYKPDADVDQSQLALSKFPITIPTHFDKIIVNSQFVTKNADFPDQYVVDPQLIVSKTLGGLKYVKTLDAVPVLIHQVWKFEDHQASVLLNLKLNEAYAEQLTLENVVVSIALSADSVSTSASSKPSGTFNKDLNRITWRFNAPLTLNSSKGETLIARFMTNGKASEHESGIQLKFSLATPPKSTEIYWNGVEVPSVRSLVSGSYSGHI